MTLTGTREGRAADKACRAEALEGASFYRVLWPDGDVFASAEGEREFARSDAQAIARCIGGALERIA